MRTVDLFCASPASTAICSSMDQRAMVRHGMRPISRHYRHIGDRKMPLPPIPCTSKLPIDPKPYYQRNRKSSAKESDFHRKNSADVKDLIRSDFHRKNSADVKDLISPPGSSRYLLSDKPFFDLLSDSDHVKALVPSQNKDSPSLKSSSARSRPRDKVVELRVSIHCKGCEGKVRKHISRMEGVTSFSIDLATKKVIIVGDVTPLGVLTSVSRVKNAQFWPSPTSSSSSSSSSPMVGLS
ncbi:protein SODIUM POTASSIUM ROOT DEFECTIVE 2-like [Actinidia eriantha]|uniref:protein SODIUM POTASSIUM ROOT DEFECTIVE 2-like n=1 Tax=Actinidia eriantha TaxID=165200 RepID=UPI0025884308|nr:protein SODIUM POTASSIUM ROOT DEFECTIVE 2-like [Actinidia eriantha]